MSTDDIRLPEDADALTTLISGLPTSSASYSYYYSVSELLVSRLTASTPSPENPSVLAMDSVLSTPALTPDAAYLKQRISYSVLADLPKERLEPYRDAFTRLATRPTEAEAAAGISERSAEILEFLDASQAWVPRSKSDDMAIRSLDLLVQSAEEMRPFVPGLLEWLQDNNWPPWRGCRAQLARFPEVAMDPIREVLRKGEDGEWEGHLLCFLEECMPKHVRERARVEVERIAQRPTPTEIENDAAESANNLLMDMDHWADRVKMFSKKV
ncbi:hypothetical protein DFH09DRAFT_1305332 [Mycena vulgaris]|nr:hypothetical protein DFH09DRAFT_1305332 [Mycena vulgaris]